MRRATALAATAAALLAAAGPRPARAGEPALGPVVWLEGLAEGRKAALAAKKPLLVVSLADVAPGRTDAKSMEIRAVLERDPDVVAKERHFVCMRVAGREAVEMFGNAADPTASSPKCLLSVRANDGLPLVTRRDWPFDDAEEAQAGLKATLDLGLEADRVVALLGSADAAARGRVALAVLVHALESSDVATRRAASDSLGYDLARDAGAAPALDRACTDEKPAVRRAALGALVRVGLAERGPLTSAALLRALDDRSPALFSFACKFVPQFKSILDRAVPALVRGARDEDRWKDALACLQKLGPAGADAAPSLAALLDTPREVPAKTTVIRVLGAMGPGARPAVPTLFALARDEESSLRSSAWDALVSIGPGARSLTPALIGLLSDRKADRRKAIAVLGAIGDGAYPALGALRALAAGEPTLESAAKDAIRRIEASAVDGR